MNIQCTSEERILHFRQPSGTSRGIYTTRKIWIVKIVDNDNPSWQGVGECAPLPNLSCDDVPDYTQLLNAFCRDFSKAGGLDIVRLKPYPSVLFGLETAILNAERGSLRLFDTPFSRGEVGIPINGLVWMGTFEEMNQRIEEKLSQGFSCIKLKIGAIDFDSELSLIRSIRQRFSKSEVELRVDANGAFEADDVLYRLEKLSRYDIHSIEQPIKANQWEALARICKQSNLPIALDEELIGVNDTNLKCQLLDYVKPHYIVIKPSLHGGMSGTREWVALAKERGIGSWITSALESNIGLNAIAHLAADIYGSDISMPQGLGTGALYTDNISLSEYQLEVSDCQLRIV